MNRRSLELRPIAALAIASSLFAGCGGGGGSGGAGGSIPATPTPAPVGSAFNCPSGNSATGVAQSPALREGTELHRGVRFLPATRLAGSSKIAIAYDSARLAQTRAAVVSKEAALGARFGRETAYASIHQTVRIVKVDPARVAAAVAAFRAQPGVIDAAPLTRKAPMRVMTPYFPDDPYFDGFAVTVTSPLTGPTPPPPTNNLPPYYQSNNVPGQWDMHAIGLERAWAYSQSNNGSGHVNAGALGRSAVRLAIIDTGEDTARPELSGKVVREGCFVTDPNGTQSTSNFTTDPDGHGTDVTGIAASRVGNGSGFVGVGGNVALMLYRVFPTPDDKCNDPSTSSGDNQCTADSTDIADAVNDAVSNGANVINLSLGGGECPDDPAEGPAIANAIARHVIVVAASGNSDGSTPSNVVQTPACDPGVIAVGATGLNDSGPSITEEVASYSEYDSTHPATWGIVAPGGDPSGNSDGDDLHWIENIFTSTPLDDKFAGNCSGDYPSETGPADCRIHIAGTSMASPHVAGAAALIVSANAAYASPAAMKSLLCSTADALPGQSANEGCGRLDVYKAMAMAVGDPSP